MGSVRLATALAPSGSEDLHAFGSVGPINSTSFSSKDSVPDMPMSSWRKRRRRRAREKKALRKRFGRKALPEGCCPQSWMRETVMSPLEMGERWGQVLLSVLGASRSEGPSPPRLDKTRPGSVVGTWPTWHVVSTSGEPPQSLSQPHTYDPS